MCELLGMSANVPTDICFSFSGLMQRGGTTGPHKDGWGIVFYDGKGYREFRDPKASVDSQIAKLVQSHPIKSHIVISHIRQANSGRVGMENTHPFCRELWGRYWSFAHNGQIKAVKKEPLQTYLPVGSTDSEYAFCWLLDQVRAHYPKPPRQPGGLFRLIHKCCLYLNQFGVFNMLLTDSRYLFAFCGKQLTWITRRAPFGEASLHDLDITVDFGQETTPGDIVTVIATQPLTKNEAWHVMKPGEFSMFKDGLEVRKILPS
jgi:glutamine amidotransferase